MTQCKARWVCLVGVVKVLAGAAIILGGAVGSLMKTTDAETAIGLIGLGGAIAVGGHGLCTAACMRWFTGDDEPPPGKG